jgi:hypothetical protein
VKPGGITISAQSLKELHRRMEGEKNSKGNLSDKNPFRKTSEPAIVCFKSFYKFKKYFKDAIKTVEIEKG